MFTVYDKSMNQGLVFVYLFCRILLGCHSRKQSERPKRFSRMPGSDGRPIYCRRGAPLHACNTVMRSKIIRRLKRSFGIIAIAYNQRMTTFVLLALFFSNYPPAGAWPGTFFWAIQRPGKSCPMYHPLNFADACCTVASSQSARSYHR